MIRAVVLDVDDTLYLERDYVRSGFVAVDEWCTQRLGISGVGTRAWELFEAGRRRTTLTDALADLGGQASPQERDGLVAAYREHEPDIAMTPDSASFVRRLVGTVPIGVITDGPAASQRAKCQALGLFAIADVILTEELGASKPDPRAFTVLAERWSLTGPDLVYVADNPHKDFVAPLELGWRTLRVRRGGSLHENVATPPGVREIHDLASVDLRDL